MASFEINDSAIHMIQQIINNLSIAIDIAGNNQDLKDDEQVFNYVVNSLSDTYYLLSKLTTMENDDEHITT